MCILQQENVVDTGIIFGCYSQLDETLPHLTLGVGALSKAGHHETYLYQLCEEKTVDNALHAGRRGFPCGTSQS